MINGILKAALLLQILCAIAGVDGQAACFNYLRHITPPESNEIIGIIEIPSPPRGVNLTLKVDMSVATTLPTKYTGKLVLAQSNKKSVRTIQRGRPLLYELHFPLQHPIPTVHGISFNDRQLCSGPRAQGNTVTTISLQHTLFPPDAMQVSGGSGGHIAPSILFPNALQLPQPTSPASNLPAPTQLAPIQPPPSMFFPEALKLPQPTPPASNLPAQTQPASTQSAPSRPAPAPTTLAPSNQLPQFFGGNVFLDSILTSNQDCGRSSNSNKINRLVFRGTTTRVGQWPWLVAIFISTSIKEFAFQCAGSLISNTHIISAAHCFRSSDGNIPAGVFHVALGRYRLRDWRERGSENRNIAEYKLHPDYNPATTNGDADLAIIVLSERVEYSATIKPICLWSGSPELDSVVGTFGLVVGWGEDENGNKYLQEPRMTREPIVNQEDCLRSNPIFVSSTSRRTFCAGSRNGTGPCNGDSGSGLIIHNPLTGRYHLRGVVSLSVKDSVSGSCDQSHFTVYVDVAKHLQWIRYQISI